LFKFKKIDMPEIILKFDSIEEAVEARTALDGAKWKYVVSEFKKYLRDRIKYECDSTPDIILAELQKVNSQLNEIIQDEELFLD
jgi:hypothetical protein